MCFSIFDLSIIFFMLRISLSIKFNISFKQISKLMGDEVVMATNSSFIQASEISKHCEHPERFINMHFFYPPIRMDLIEISYPANVSKEVLERTKTVSEKMGRSVVVLKKETPGFIVNRMLAALVDEAYELYDEGIADFKDIDLAIKKGLNHPLGPFELSDYSGLDIHYYAKLKRFEESKKYLQLAVRLMPADPIVNDHYGDVLWKNGNEIQARYYWNYVLNLEKAEDDLKKVIEEKLTKGL